MMNNYGRILFSYTVILAFTVITGFSQEIISDQNPRTNQPNISAEFPFEFKLVAYMDPVIKRTRVDLVLLRGKEIIAEGSTEVNDPLHWNGMNFFHTATDRDKSGNPYIGIHITLYPGVEVVYTGFSVISLGAVFYIRRKMLGRR